MPSHTDPNLLRPAYVMDDPADERRERLPPEDDDERVLRACRARLPDVDSGDSEANRMGTRIHALLLGDA